MSKYDPPKHTALLLAAGLKDLKWIDKEIVKYV